MPARPENIHKHIEALERILNGELWQEVADSHNVTAASVRVWAKQLFKMMIKPERMTEYYPDHDWWVVNFARKYKDFWLRRLDALKKELADAGNS